MTQRVLDNRTFSNKSTSRVGEVSTFGASKFTPSQTQDRLKEHAKALTTGVGTLPQLVELWKSRFGISISVTTEKEFRQRNRDKIEQIALEMIEAGELTVPSLGADAVQAAVTNKLMFSKRLIGQMQKVMLNMINKILASKGAQLNPSGTYTKMVPNKKATGGKAAHRIKPPASIYDVATLTSLYKALTDDFRQDLKLVNETSAARKLHKDRVDKAAKESLPLKEQITELPPDSDIEITDEMRQAFDPEQTDEG
jgi:hypothetical protein